MRIGMMADVYKPHISGITNYISLNKRYLEKLGHQVHVFTFGDNDYPDDEPNVIRSPGLPLLETGYYISLRYNSQARHILRSMDVVHVHHPFLSGSLALSYCRPRGIPIIFTNHTRYDLYTQAYLPAVPDVVGSAALQAYLPAFCRACDMVISPSPGMRDVLVSFGVEVPIEVVPNGVDITPFQQVTSPIERAELGFGKDDVILLFIGRLGPEKNVAFLLRSFAGAVQAFEHARLLVIGDGPERENLEDRASHMGIEAYVRFLGPQPYEKIPSYTSICDAFVTASVTEVHPLTVIEAMAAGLPVLGIRSPGVGDTIQEGLTGYLVAEPDLASFTAKMVRLIVDAEGRQRMAEQSRIAANDYAIERTARLMEAIYTRTVQKAAGRKRGFRARWIRWLDRFSR